MCFREKKWQYFLLVLFLFAGLFTSNLIGGFFDIPNEINLVEGQTYEVSQNLPFRVFVNQGQEDVIQLDTDSFKSGASFHINSIKGGTANLKFKLLGIIPYKNVMVNVVPELKVVPGGHSVGIKLKSEGVIVIEYSDIIQSGKVVNPAKEAGIKIGDIILKINDETLLNLDHAADLIAKSEGKPLTLEIKRDEKILTKTIQAEFCEEDRQYRIGVWIRDTAAGVGTLTFYEPTTKSFGALGHIITDADTGESFQLRKGEVLTANIVAIQKGEKGIPGEKRGAFDEKSGFTGSLTKNTKYGVFGTVREEITNEYYPEPIPVGLISQVKTGKAEIMTVLEGDQIEKFEVQIEKVFAQDKPSTKGMVLKVTDKRLLEMTGGIIQGMSGSPIIQDGRLIGAVTHVFTNRPEMGYGIFAEWMLREIGLRAEN